MINEQANVYTYQGLKSSGFTQSDQPPSGFDPKTWTRVRLDKKWWYKKGATVPQPQPIQPQVGDLSKYVGVYQTDSSPYVKGRIKNINGTLTIDFKLPNVGDMLEDLVPVSDNVFKLKKSTGIVTFIPDNDGEINSLKFAYKYGLINIEKTATKVNTDPDSEIKKDETKPTDTTKTDTTKTDTKVDTGTTTKTDNTDKTIITKYDPVTNRHEALNTRDCSSFPFTMGCINPKIGMLNQIFFGDPLSNIYGKNLYNTLDSYGYFGMPGEKDGEISQTLYDSAIKNSKQQNESITNKTIIKESVKKVLKQYINKKK